MVKTRTPASGHARPEHAQQGRPRWGRADALLLGLCPLTLALIAAQFALAGFGAFTMAKTPTDGDAYAAHIVLGIVIGLLTWLTLGAVAASRAARSHRRMLGAALTLALLAIPVEPLLGEAGQHVPAVGALHALTGLLIFVLAAWLTAATVRRRATVHGARPAAPGSRP